MRFLKKKPKKVTALDVSHQDLGDINALYSAIMNMGQMESVRLAGCNLGANGAKAVAAYVEDSNSLLSLDLRNNELGPDGAQHLGTALKTNKSITELDISNGGIGAEGAIYIADALKASTSLTSLDLEGNNIRSSGAKAIGDAVNGNASLTKINVGDNNIDSAAALELVRVFKIKDQMTEIGLAGCNLGRDGALVVADYILNSASLTFLNLYFNFLGDEGAKAISSALADNKQSKLATLGIDSNEIGVEGATAIADCLAGSASLTSLNLQSNKLGPNGAKALAARVANSASLTFLNLGINDIGDDGATAIAKALKDSNVSKLASLDLNQNDPFRKAKIGSAGAAQLAAYLAVSTSLTSLNLWDNRIGTEGAKAIADALRVNASLTFLNLGINDIGDEGATAIAKALKDSNVSKLASLDLSSNNIGSAACAKELAAYLADSASLTSLNVCMTGITGAGAQELAEAVLGKPTLETFCEIPLKQLRANSLKELNLVGKGVGVSGVLVLAGLLKISDSLKFLNLAENNLGSETDDIKANNVKGTSFQPGNAVTYQGRNMIVSEGENSDGAIKMVDQTVVKALADALHYNTSLTKLDVTHCGLKLVEKDFLREAVRAGFVLNS